MKHKCNNCGRTGSDRSLKVTLEEIPDLNQRLDAGSVVPSGECPKCGALCYVVLPPRKPEPYIADALYAAQEWLNDMSCEHDDDARDPNCVVCKVNIAIERMEKEAK